MTERLVIDTFAMAFKQRSVITGLVIYSDRGVQYHSHPYLDFMAIKGCGATMSRK
jgi:hypothetical protein